MLRAISMFSLGGIFLMISPKLRLSAEEAIGSVYMGVQLYAPFSYVGLVILVIAALMTSLYRGSQPR